MSLSHKMPGGIKEVILVFDLKWEMTEFIVKHLHLDQERVAENSVMIITEEAHGEVNHRSPEKGIIVPSSHIVRVVHRENV
jgi:hypothetical protein